jgi:nucleophosmin 1
MSGKRSAPGGGNKTPQKKVRLDEDDDEDDVNDEEEDEEERKKASSEEICTSYPSQKCTKIKPKWKRLKITHTTIKGSRVLQTTGKTPKTPKGPSSVDIKAKGQISIEKCGSLPKVEAS